MKRVIGVAILAILSVGWHATVASADCGTKLFGTAWNCNANCGSFTESRCMEFGNYGLSSNFDMFISGFSGNEGCTCQAAGSEKSPKFDASSSAFVCTETIFPSSFLGKVGSKNLTGQYWDWTGLQCLYACTKRSSVCP
jgi:hypothetical protein